MSQWWGSMAVTVIAGLTLATILTLVVVPTLYSLMAGLSQSVLNGSAEPERPRPPMPEPEAIKESLTGDQA
jgi:hypothetical protein